MCFYFYQRNDFFCTNPGTKGADGDDMTEMIGAIDLYYMNLYCFILEFLLFYDCFFV